MQAKRHRQLSFEQKLAFAFALSVLCAGLIGFFSLLTIQSISSTKDVMTFVHARDLVDAMQARNAHRKVVMDFQSYLLTFDRGYLPKLDADRKQLTGMVRFMEEYHSDPVDLDYIDEIQTTTESAYRSILQVVRLLAKRGGRPASQAGLLRLAKDPFSKIELASAALDRYVHFEQISFGNANQEAQALVAGNLRHFAMATAFVLILTAGFAVLFSWTLSRLNRRIARALSARESFLRIVTHDLKLPLTSIGMCSELISLHPEKQESARKCALTISESVRRMSRLISDILDQAKIEAGSVRLERRSEDVLGLAAIAVEGLRPLADRKKIRVVIQKPESPVLALVDRERLLQILSNLMGNAIKFTPENGEIVLSVLAGVDEARVEVENTGPLIPKEHIQSLFEPYWQARKGEGSGLGLAISKGLVEAHGGRIWAFSRNDRNVFAFTIPDGRQVRAAA